MTSRCYLLELPPELRLNIYSHLYSTHSEPLLILRTNTQISQPHHRWFTHPGPGLLLTCRKLHREAWPTLYSNTNFKFQIYIGDGWPTYAPAGPLDASNGLLRRIQRAEVTCHLVAAAHIGPALKRLRILAEAFEASETGFARDGLRVTFKAVTSFRMEVDRGLVRRHLDEALELLGDEGRGDGLFRRMLVEGRIVSIK